MLLPLFASLILGQTVFPDPIFLSFFPVSRSADMESGTVEIDARVTGRTFAELTARRVARYVGPGRFMATLASYPASRDKPKRAYVQCTFLVDCDEAPVRTASAMARTELGDGMGMAALTGWVSRYITKKTFSRQFDLASVVATSREGDCTEHAVLLAALARAQKIPSRVVTGLALVDVSGNVDALGHAWVEWYDGKHWLPADAALSTDELAKFGGKSPPRVSYLPVRIIEREDAGFSGSLLNGPDTTDITGLVFPAAAEKRGEAR